uniref:CUB domain-containing protein n=1 Tax=Heterorhabditis bacteriophora TaxID=37862 RepID=A0A1I7XS68_HETBA
MDTMKKIPNDEILRLGLLRNNSFMVNKYDVRLHKSGFQHESMNNCNNYIIVVIVASIKQYKYYVFVHGLWSGGPVYRVEYKISYRKTERIGNNQWSDTSTYGQPVSFSHKTAGCLIILTFDRELHNVTAFSKSVMTRALLNKEKPLQSPRSQWKVSYANRKKEITLNSSDRA